MHRRQSIAGNSELPGKARPFRLGKMQKLPKLWVSHKPCDSLKFCLRTCLIRIVSTIYQCVSITKYRKYILVWEKIILELTLILPIIGAFVSWDFVQGHVV